MTFELIQQTLGEPATHAIAEAVLRTANAGQAAKDPVQYDRALRELLTALLAVVVTRGGASEQALAEHQSERLRDLITTMGAIENQTGDQEIVVH